MAEITNPTDVMIVGKKVISSSENNEYPSNRSNNCRPNKTMWIKKIMIAKAKLKIAFLWGTIW